MIFNSPLLQLQGDLTAENINALKDFFGDQNSFPYPSSQFKGSLTSRESKTTPHLQRVVLQACIPNRKPIPGMDNLGGTKLYLIYLSSRSRQQLGSHSPFMVLEILFQINLKSSMSHSFIHIKINCCSIQLENMRFNMCLCVCVCMYVCIFF